MAQDTGPGLFKWVDGALRTGTAVLIPVVAFFIDSSLKLQAAAIARQNTAFSRTMHTREKNVDVTLKFYDVISSI